MHGTGFGKRLFAEGHGDILLELCCVISSLVNESELYDVYMDHEYTSSTRNLAAREGTSKSSAFGSSPYKGNHFEAGTANALIRSVTFPPTQCPIYTS